MGDRLQELLHQKALLNEHAAWLEREIMAERQRTGEPTVPEQIPAIEAPPAETPPSDTQPTDTTSIDTPPAEPLPNPPAPRSTGDTNANAIFEHYRSNPRSLQQEVKRGCFLYFFGALVLLGLGIAVIYLIYHGK
jgi:hypothetical protein